MKKNHQKEHLQALPAAEVAAEAANAQAAPQLE